jgi:subtilisin family serine protease
MSDRTLQFGDMPATADEPRRTFMRRLLLSAAALAVAAVVAGCGGSESSPEPTAAASAEKSQGAAALKSAVTETTAAKIDRRLAGARGPVQVWVSFDQDSLAQHRAKLAAAGNERQRVLAAKPGGETVSAESATVRAAMSAQRSAIRAQHAEASARLAGLGASELARVSVAHNAVAVRVDAAQLGSIAAMPGVVRVRPVINYELHLAETVPYVGGAALQAAGFDGTGVRVAVLDSGADFTHRNLGGPGTVADFTTCYAQANVAPSGPCAALFGPAAPKVIGGHDFVGENWPNTTGGVTEPDPNPIARANTGGHGTHVADIIAGRSADGTHKGMAPKAKILAVKVCSAVATSCSGVALLQGVDFALDPNGDGDIGDAVDVMNLSLGSDYGQIEDDLTLALTNAVNAGVMVVASAGNGGDRPYKVGSPSIAPGVLSVAQTQVPSALAYSLVVTGITPSTINNTATVEWAPVGSGFSGPVVRLGRGCPALSIDGANPDDPYFNGNSPAGKVALIDRGSCAVSLKIDRAKKAGAIAVIIANNTGGDPPSFSFGGGDLPLPPTVIITQSDGSRIKTALGATGVNPAVVATVSGSATIPLVGSMVATSSRGPSSLQALKPEIGAPGASVSAEVGTGNGETAFGGTSGAAPMVAGAAALLVQAFPSRSPMQIKAMLMNSAETAIYTNPATKPGELAPVSRIGAGELRVQRAAALGAIAWNPESRSAALAFGALEVAGPAVVVRKLRIENFGHSAKRFTIGSSFRFANDQASGAVKLQAPSNVTVPAHGSVEIPVTLLVDGSKLPEWTLDGGPQGGDGAALTGPEYDGYLQLTAGSERLSVPWHVLPRKAALAFGVPVRDRSGRSVYLTNLGAEVGAYDLFSLMGVSGQLPRSALPEPGDNFTVTDLKAFGARYDAGCDCLQFAISTYGRRPHPLYPRGLEVDIDTGAGGLYFVYQDELGGFGGSGQSVVYVQKAGATTRSAFFFNDADLNSGNTIYTVPMSALGLATPAGRSTTLTIDVYAYDNYFSGNLSDSITGMKFTPAAPRFSAVENTGTVPRFAVSKVPFTLDGSVTDAQSSESGVLLMYRRNAGFEDQALPIGR